MTKKACWRAGQLAMGQKIEDMSEQMNIDKLWNAQDAVTSCSCQLASLPARQLACASGARA